MTTNHPDREVVREYLAKRHAEKLPPPTPEEIRRQLGWRLEPNNEDAQCAR
jgi:hypothetical protein